MDVGQREPHDEKTPAEVVEIVLRAAGVMQPQAVAAEVMDALVYKAYFEEEEPGLRWLDSGGILDRVLNG